MKRKKAITIGLGLLMFMGFIVNAQTNTKQTGRQEPAIAIMYAHPELAEEYCCHTVTAFAPDPESLNITYCKAQYIPLYRAYIVNCYFDTNDAYGEMQSYKIQMHVQVLPAANGGLKYNALDFKELRQ